MTPFFERTSLLYTVKGSRNKFKIHDSIIAEYIGKIYAKLSALLKNTLKRRIFISLPEEFPPDQET